MHRLRMLNIVLAMSATSPIFDAIAQESTPEKSPENPVVNSNVDSTSTKELTEKESTTQPQIDTTLVASSPVVGATLSFEDAINRALGSSAQVEAATHGLQAQTERKRGNWANIGPKVSAEYTDVRFDTKQTADFGGREIILRDDKSKTGSVTVAQPITGLWGLAEKARYEGAQEDLKEQSLNLTKADVAFNTAEAYMRAKQAIRSLEIAETSVLASQSQLRDAQALERAGRMNRGDVLKLELAVSEAKARKAQATAQKDIALAALREAIGLPTDAALALDATIPAPQASSLPAFEQAYKQAIDKRIDPQQAKTMVEVANFGKKLAYAQMTPQVSLFYKYDRNFGEATGLGGGDKDTRSYGVQVTWDVWNNGSTIFSLREAISSVDQAEAGYRGTEQKIRLDVYGTLENLKAARESLDLAEVAVKQAEEFYRIEEVRFKSGTRSATDLILAESSRAGAQGRYVAAATDLTVWNFRLQKSLGDQRPRL